MKKDLLYEILYKHLLKSTSLKMQTSSFKTVQLVPEIKTYYTRLLYRVALLIQYRELNVSDPKASSKVTEIKENKPWREHLNLLLPSVVRLKEIIFDSV